jgi:hypothetical protein
MSSTIIAIRSARVLATLARSSIASGPGESNIPRTTPSPIRR